jgi:transcriptional repressor NrdR
MRIEDRLLTSGEREVSTQMLGELVMAELKKLDKVAYVRFASVYKSFEDIGEFVEAIREMQGPQPRRIKS